MIAGALLIVAGLALAVASWFLSPAFGLGWVAALFTLLGWPLGSTALLLIHALTGGKWGEAIRPALLLGLSVLPVVLLASVPVALLLPSLYPWMQEAVAHRLLNTWYLNVPFLSARAAAYAVVWLGLGALTLLGAQGRGPAPERIAPAGLILLAFTVTFASIDLVMSLEPEWSSSVWGMLTGAGMTLFALSVAVLFAVPGARGEGRDQLGKLLLALCILWTYLDFVQLLIVWSSNLHSDAPWYARRFHGFWAWSLAAMDLVHALGAVLLFGIPRFRRNDPAVATFAALLVAFGILRAWWLVLPASRPAPGLTDVACMAALGAIATGALLLARRWAPFAREPAHG